MQSAKLRAVQIRGLAPCRAATEAIEFAFNSFEAMRRVSSAIAYERMEGFVGLPTGLKGQQCRRGLPPARVKACPDPCRNKLCRALGAVDKGYPKFD
jgi:hypothetical protein